MTTIEVEDPETGERVTFSVVQRGGKEYYQRLPASNFDLAQRSPRQLEATAAFAEVASTAYGRRSTDGTPPGIEAVRKGMKSRFLKAPTATQLRAIEKQERYASLMDPEVRELASTLARQGSRAKVVPRRRARRELPVPVTARVIPALGDLPAPSYY